ncbi:MAG: DUF3378 domain-containing protein [Mycoplasmataceae bacterium]|nr:DUF3378 domain-containing protein [Mycoplasmataceae bacterium]
MNTFSKKINKEEEKFIMKNYSNFELESNNQYIKFFAKTNEITISLYTSSKIVISGFRLEENDLVKYLNNFEVNENIVGSDETGTGDLFGPIIITAVKFNNKTSDVLKKINVGDSKKISDNIIEDYYLKLINNVESKTIIIEPENYNEMYKRTGNIKSIISWGHFKVQNMIGGDYKRIIDQFVNKSKFFEYISKDSNEYDDWLFETKSEDKYPQVAVASIIARHKLNEWFKINNEKNSFELKKGNSYTRDELKVLIKKIGKDNIKSYAKKDFKNIKNLV